MHITVLCATQRGYDFVERLFQLVDKSTQITVFSFREEAWEPPFLDQIRELTSINGGQFFETRQVSSATLKPFWDATPVDVLFAVSWRYLIPEHLYAKARLGAYVFHDSMLPKYRGFAPTVWAIINGEIETGVTLFKIAEDVDSGDIVAQQRVAIGPDETIATVIQHVTNAYLHLLEHNLPQILDRTVQAVPQDHSLATFTCKRLPEDSRIDWTASTVNIYNMIRASTKPYPGAFTFLDGKKLHIWGARRTSERKFVGRVVGRVVEVCPGRGSIVLTGDGELLITQVSLEDGELVPAETVLNSLRQTLG